MLFLGFEIYVWSFYDNKGFIHIIYDLVWLFRIIYDLVWLLRILEEGQPRQ